MGLIWTLSYGAKTKAAYLVFCWCQPKASISVTSIKDDNWCTIVPTYFTEPNKHWIELGSETAGSLR